jgi:hypothetical protein
LNNDVIVTQGRLERLVSLASTAADVGMVAPMSNHAPAPLLVGPVPYSIELVRDELQPGQRPSPLRHEQPGCSGGIRAACRIDPVASRRRITPIPSAPQASSRESALIGPVVFPLLIFLFPLAFYCLVLAYVNRGRRPLLVPGIWDGIGLLFGLSGLLLATAPMLLSRLFDRIQLMYPGIDDFTATLTLWIGYYALIVCAAALLLVARRHKSVIYNVDTDLFGERLAGALTGLGLNYAVRSGRLVVGVAESVTTIPAPTQLTDAITAGAVSAPPRAAPPIQTNHATPGGPRHAELSVDPFPMFCHVTLHWENYAPALRREIENRLARGLDDAVAVDNPAAVWLLGFSGLVFGGMTVLGAFLAFVVLFNWLNAR